MPTTYDHIVVGAGSSGAVIAARLSEDPDRSVLLLEAGPDYARLEDTPDDLLNAYWMSLVNHDWGFSAEAVPGREIDYARGKVSGGSSAVNGVVAIRGVPADYDEWAELGNEDWSWEACLPYFRKLEDDQDQGGDHHGKGGPIPVVRWQDDELVPVQRAFQEVCIEQGFPYHEDFNHPDATGVSPMAQNRRGRTRISTAIGYLSGIRHRLNLTIRPHCIVNRVLLEDGRVTGLEVDTGGERQTVYGREVILSAGAIQSPPILMRSGIGRQDDLEAIGVPQALELSGVGHHLIEHPMCAVMMVPKDGVCDMDKNPFFQAMLRYTSDGGEENDMQVYLPNHFDLRDLPELHEIFGVDVALVLLPGLQRPNSIGRLRVTSADPEQQPEIELNFLDDDEDRRRMREGMRIAWKIANSPKIQQFVERIEMLDQATIDDDEALDKYIWDTATQIFHPVGTAKMGPASDPEAVVDQHGRVHGVEGLRVADASIMPKIVRANTNLTCIMIGERVADWIKAEE